jgi:hypothetical protein
MLKSFYIEVMKSTKVKTDLCGSVKEALENKSSGEDGLHVSECTNDFAIISLVVKSNRSVMILRREGELVTNEIVE